MSTIQIGVLDIGNHYRLYYKAFYYYRELQIRTRDTKVFTSKGAVNLDIHGKFNSNIIYNVPLEKWLEMSKLNVKDIEVFTLLITMIETYPEIKVKRYTY